MEDVKRYKAQKDREIELISKNAWGKTKTKVVQMKKLIDATFESNIITACLIEKYVLLLFVVDDEVARYTINYSQKTRIQIKFIQDVVLLLKVCKLNFSVRKKSCKFFPGKCLLIRKMKMDLRYSQINYHYYFCCCHRQYQANWLIMS